MATFPSPFDTVGSSPTSGRSLGQVSPERWEGAFLVIALLFFSGAQLFHAQGYNTDVGASDPRLFAIQAFVYACFMPFFLRHRTTIGRAAKYTVGVWLLIGLAFCSALWSLNPANSVKHVILLFITTLFGVYFGSRFDVSEQLRILAIAFACAVVLSAASGLLFPGYGIMAYEPIGAWCGIYSHRNELARMMVLAILVFSLHKRLGGNRFWNSVGILFAVGLIGLSKSVTGLLCIVVVVLVLKGSRILLWKTWTKLIAATALGAPLTYVVAWLIANWSRVMDSLGRTASLSGRVPLWITCVILGIRKPWLGYGYNSFWLGYEGPSRVVWKVVGWPAPNAHNGFLDIWLSLGLVGLAIFCMFFFHLLWRAISSVHAPSPAAVWPFAYVVLVFLYNIDETNLFQQNSLIWILLVAVSVSLSRAKWTSPRPSKDVNSATHVGPATTPATGTLS